MAAVRLLSRLSLPQYAVHTDTSVVSTPESSNKSSLHTIRLAANIVAKRKLSIWHEHWRNGLLKRKSPNKSPLRIRRLTSLSVVAGLSRTSSRAWKHHQTLHLSILYLNSLLQFNTALRNTLFKTSTPFSSFSLPTGKRSSFSSSHSQE